MDREEIRKFILEVLEEEVHRQGGVYDQCRQKAFALLRAILIDDAERRIKSLEAPLQ